MRRFPATDAAAADILLPNSRIPMLPLIELWHLFLCEGGIVWIERLALWLQLLPVGLLMLLLMGRLFREVVFEGRVLMALRQQFLICTLRRLAILIKLLLVTLPQLFIHLCVIISQRLQLAALHDVAVVVGLGAHAAHLQLRVC